LLGAFLAFAFPILAHARTWLPHRQPMALTRRLPPGSRQAAAAGAGRRARHLVALHAARRAGRVAWRGNYRGRTLRRAPSHAAARRRGRRGRRAPVSRDQPRGLALGPIRPAECAPGHAAGRCSGRRGRRACVPRLASGPFPRPCSSRVMCSLAEWPRNAISAVSPQQLLVGPPGDGLGGRSGPGGAPALDALYDGCASWWTQARAPPKGSQCYAPAHRLSVMHPAHRASVSRTHHLAQDSTFACSRCWRQSSHVLTGARAMAPPPLPHRQPGPT